MAWRVTILIMCIVAMSVSGLLNSLIFLQMEDDINRRKGNPGPIRLSSSSLRRIADVKQEYRALFPNGRLWRAFAWTMGVGYIAGLIAAYMLFFGLRDYAVPSR